MKKIILLCLFTSNIIYAQNDALIIYIDASASSTKLIDIQNEVNSLVDSRNNSDVYLFISKGESPVVTNDRKFVKKQLRRLRTDFITPPDYINDVKKINSALLENNHIININNISNNSGLDNQVEIHFWMQEENYNSLQLDKKLVDPLLFSNKLIFKEGLNKNCTAILHLTNSKEIKKVIYE